MEADALCVVLAEHCEYAVFQREAGENGAL